MTKKLLVAAVLAAVVSTDVQAQFTQQGGFRLRNVDGSPDQGQLYKGFISNLGNGTGRVQSNGTFVLDDARAFTLAWSAASQTWSFSAGVYSGGTTSLTYGTLYNGVTAAAPTFNAFRYQIKGGVDQSQTVLSSLRYNGIELLGAPVSAGGSLTDTWAGLSAAQDFVIDGMFEFTSPAGNNESQVFELNFGTASGDANRIPVPEPASVALLTAGLAGLGLAARRRRA